jgi:sigma-E factor negative regulatory protein RseA
MVMNEDLSRMMDGELPDGDVDRVVAQCRGEDVLAAWACYHIIGDTLRGTRALSPALSRRLSHALAAEPTVLAPRRAAPRGVASWAWAAAATIAAVSVVGWTAVSLTQTPGTAVAKAREASAVTAAQLRPQALPQDYVLVHQEYSPATAIQGVGPYLRAVSAAGGDARP